MKTPLPRLLENVYILLRALVYLAFALRRAALSFFTRTPPGLTHTQGTARYYVRSDHNSSPPEGLPVIICIGHTFEKPNVLKHFVGRFDEPVLLVWSAQNR